MTSSHSSSVAPAQIGFNFSDVESALSRASSGTVDWTSQQRQQEHLTVNSEEAVGPFHGIDQPSQHQEFESVDELGF